MPSTGNRSTRRNTAAAPGLEQYLTTRQVCELLGISDKTLFRWVTEGKLRAYKPTQRSMRFRADEVQAFMDSTLVPTVGTVGE